MNRPPPSENRIDCVFIGPLPPPLHGMSSVNQAMLEKLKTTLKVAIVDVSPGSLKRGLIYHFTKAIRSFTVPLKLIGSKLHGARFIYASVDDGLGSLWLIFHLFFARALSYKIYLHHHSFRYLLRRSRLISTAVRMAGQHALHVTLCEEMSQQLLDLYPACKKTFSAPNSVNEPENLTLPKSLEDRPLRIGFLANLTFEKGLSEFIDIVELINAKATRISGVIAGPPASDEIRDFILGKVAISEGSLVWIGPVAGSTKLEFFTSIDIFVFPTKYRTEALPLVLLESLVHGVPIISPERGCICVFKPFTAAKIISRSKDFKKEAVAFIEKILDNPDFHANLLHAASTEGIIYNAANEKRRDTLVSLMISENFPV